MVGSGERETAIRRDAETEGWRDRTLGQPTSTHRHPHASQQASPTASVLRHPTPLTCSVEDYSVGEHPLGSKRVRHVLQRLVHGRQLSRQLPPHRIREIFLGVLVAVVLRHLGRAVGVLPDSDRWQSGVRCEARGGGRRGRDRPGMEGTGKAAPPGQPCGFGSARTTATRSGGWNSARCRRRCSTLYCESARRIVPPWASIAAGLRPGSTRARRTPPTPHGCSRGRSWARGRRGSRVRTCRSGGEASA